MKKLHVSRKQKKFAFQLLKSIIPKVAQAEANAKAKLVSAEAEAKANELLENSLTDKILQEMYIEKWDGKLSSVIAGEEAMLMLPFGTN